MECPLYPTIIDASKGDDIKSANTHMHGSARNKTCSLFLSIITKLNRFEGRTQPQQ